MNLHVFFFMVKQKQKSDQNMHRFFNKVLGKSILETLIPGYDFVII